MIQSIPFEQTLVGSYRMKGERLERAMELKVEASPRRPFSVFSRAPLDVTGSIYADGLATQRPVTGRVELRRLSTGRGAYTLRFCGDDGRELSLSLRRHSALRTPIFSFSRFVGELSDAAGAVGAVELRVDLRRTLLRWLVM